MRCYLDRCDEPALDRLTMLVSGIERPLCQDHAEVVASLTTLEEKRCAQAQRFKRVAEGHTGDLDG